MPLTEQERVFIERRAKLVRVWPIVGAICLAGVLCLTAWLWFTRPWLVNPWAVFSGLEAGLIPGPTILLMAAMLPVVVLTSLFVLVVCLLYCFAAFSNERKHLEIIRRLNAALETPSDGI
jgi:hypothetical protein